MNGKCNDSDCDYPSCNCWEIKRRYSQQRVRELESALIEASEIIETDFCGETQETIRFKNLAKNNIKPQQTP